MAFTYDPTTDRGRVRLLISDTDTATAANQVFTDAEIDAFLSMEGSEVFSAAAAACQAIAASAAKSAIAYKALGREGLNMDKRSVPEHFRALAKQYRERSLVPHEEIDSTDHRIDSFGRDRSEYVGSVI